MKGKKRLFLFAVVGLILLSVLAAPVAAKTTWTEFAGRSTPIPCDTCSPGRVWVSEDGILHIRGMQELYDNNYGDPRITGHDLVTVNVNFQLPAASGPMWCTARLENADGYWEGTAVGYRTEQGFSYLHEVLHGHGAYEGLQAHLDLVRKTPDPTASFTVHGVIMDPGGE